MRPLTTSTSVAAKKPTALGSDRLTSRNGFPTMIAPASNPPSNGVHRQPVATSATRDEQADDDANFAVERTKQEEFRSIGQGIDERSARVPLVRGVKGRRARNLVKDIGVIPSSNETF